MDECLPYRKGCDKKEHFYRREQQFF